VLGLVLGRRSTLAVSFHDTLLAVSRLWRVDTWSSSSRCDSEADVVVGLTDEARRDQRVGDRDDVAAANTAATVLGRRASRPLPSARAMIDSDRDGRRSESDGATAAASTFDCASLLSLHAASATRNTLDLSINDHGNEEIENNESKGQ